MAKLLRIQEVQERVGLCRSTIYERMRQGTFPASVPIGDKAVRWLEQDIEDWIDQHVQKRREVQ